MRTGLVVAAVAAAVLAFAAPAAASPCNSASGMDSVEYALGIAGAPLEPPDPPDPTPYEPDCDIMEWECDSGCNGVTSDDDEWVICFEDCMDRAGCS